jgi:hypothetical protein
MTKISTKLRNQIVESLSIEEFASMKGMTPEDSDKFIFQKAFALKEKPKPEKTPEDFKNEQAPFITNLLPIINVFVSNLQDMESFYAAKEAVLKAAVGLGFETKRKNNKLSEEDRAEKKVMSILGQRFREENKIEGRGRRSPEFQDKWLQFLAANKDNEMKKILGEGVGAE